VLGAGCLEWGLGGSRRGSAGFAGGVLRAACLEWGLGEAGDSWHSKCHCICMARVDRYEDLICWQFADKLADLVDAMTSRGAVLRDHDLRRQLRKAVSKAPAQISEGFVRYSPADTANLLRIARASLAEVRNHLRRGHKRGYWNEEDYDKAMALSDRALGATTNFMAERLRTAEEQARKPAKQRRLPAPTKKTAPSTSQE